jgi:hypothetical protein
MKKITAVLLPLTLCAATAFGLEDESSIVRWNSIVGVITAPGVDNPVGTIHGGAGPLVRSWWTRASKSLKRTYKL